jgi:hypothetical protein
MQRTHELPQRWSQLLHNKQSETVPVFNATVGFLISRLELSGRNPSWYDDCGVGRGKTKVSAEQFTHI